MAGCSKILLIDDDAVSRKLFTGLLSKWGYDVVVVSAVNEAIAQLDDLGNQIKLIVSDYHLSDNTLGTDIASHLKNSSRNIPFILISGDSEIGKFARLKKDGAISEFCPKNNKESLRKALGGFIPTHEVALPASSPTLC